MAYGKPYPAICRKGKALGKAQGLDDALADISNSSKQTFPGISVLMVLRLLSTAPMAPLIGWPLIVFQELGAEVVPLAVEPTLQHQCCGAGHFAGSDAPTSGHGADLGIAP